MLVMLIYYSFFKFLIVPFFLLRYGEEMQPDTLADKYCCVYGGLVDDQCLSKDRQYIVI